MSPLILPRRLRHGHSVARHQRGFILSPYRFGAGPPPGGFPVIESDTFTPIAAGGTNHYMDMPATVVAGRELVLSVVFDGADAVTTPSGWTARGNGNDAGGGGTRQWNYSKIAAGTEGGTTVNVVTAGYRIGIGLCIQLSNCATTGTYYATSAGKLIGGANTTPNTLTPAWGALDTLWMTIAAGYYDLVPDQYPLPDNQTHYNHGFGSMCMYLATKEQNTATQTPAQIQFPSTQYGTIFTIGIKPL